MQSLLIAKSGVEMLEAFKILDAKHKPSGGVSKKEMIKIRGMVHPNSLSQDMNRPFIYVNNLIRVM